MLNSYVPCTDLANFTYICSGIERRGLGAMKSLIAEHCGVAVAVFLITKQ